MKRFEVDGVPFLVSDKCGEASRAVPLASDVKACHERCLQMLEAHPDWHLLEIGGVVTCDGPKADGSCGAFPNLPALEQEPGYFENSTTQIRLQ